MNVADTRQCQEDQEVKLIPPNRSYLTSAASGAASYIPGLGASAPSAEGATDAAKEGVGAAQKGLGAAGYVVLLEKKVALSEHT